MKQLFYAVFTVAFLLAGCNKEEVQVFSLENKFMLNQQFQSADKSLKFTITEINDSRCPSDVVCIWQGEAIVKINVEAPVSGKLELSTFHNQADTLGNYSFRLIEVSPYPISTKAIKLEDYEVKLKIEEL